VEYIGSLTSIPKIIKNKNNFVLINCGILSMLEGIIRELDESHINIIIINIGKDAVIVYNIRYILA
jgi:hypothetical protein